MRGHTLPLLCAIFVFSPSAFERLDVRDDGIRNLVERLLARVHHEVVVLALTPVAARVVVVVACALLVLGIELLEALAFIDRLASFS